MGGSGADCYVTAIGSTGERVLQSLVAQITLTLALTLQSIVAQITLTLALSP